ncbi:MAG: Cysteine synthase (EC [uncultured Paraburkholderia sp.]|uniref:PLP-dependent cysteine synthase family protein n=1 Tax=uncultured Paraburkholderia sp. TaxID=1822466 RepID=UPI00259566E5|nr:cysteine synthase family protein [uncultured Paraburkholderia sp.]CAH2904004.1 MAG: Cysteine synthase (EC [uncultured Paraburkholderia sp.]CAH2943186.1 MAG: Cysteine synthase (EC [uncultured Paraburkholderia sp.]
MKTSNLRIVRSLREAIGRTPLYRTKYLSKNPSVEIYLKLEFLNPGGSIKDRTALGMIDQAEQDGRLRSNSRIIESSSGNTAIGLAMLAKSSGYHVTAVCDRHLPATKKARLLAFGADTVFLPDTPPGMDTVELRIAIAKHLADAIPDGVSLGQYSDPANPAIHRKTTGPEILDALDGRVTAVIAAVGTCGTISGVGQAMKAYNPAIRIIGVEPIGSIIFGGEDAMYHIQGGGLSFIPSILDRSVIDSGIKVSDASAIGAVHSFGKSEGIMVGGTGGLVLKALADLSEQSPDASVLVGIIPDAGDRYLDTLFDSDWLRRHHFSDLTLMPTSGDPLNDAVTDLGCSLNEIPSTRGPALDDLCSRLSVGVPAVVGKFLSASA